MVRAGEGAVVGPGPRLGQGSCRDALGPGALGDGFSFNRRRKAAIPIAGKTRGLSCVAHSPRER